MIDDIDEKIEFFLKNKVYTYIKLTSGIFFNGFILPSNNNKQIKFKDDVLGELPVLKKDIISIDYSKKRREAKL